MRKRVVIILLSMVLLFSFLSGCVMKAEKLNGTIDTAGTTMNPGVSNPDSSIPTVNENSSDETVSLITIPDVYELTYPQYIALSQEAQKAVMETFSSVEEFLQWLENSKKEHEEFQDKLMNTGSSDAGDNTPNDGDSDTPVQTLPPESEGITFLDYQAMSGEEQRRFINSFPSIDAFMAWHAAALQEYKDSMVEWGS